MQQVNTEISSSANNYKVDEIDLFIQKNQKFYSKRFKKMKETGKSISWNWAAFFFGVYWMVYRKMYFKAVAFFILSIVASSTPYIGILLNFAVMTGISIYANALYLDDVEGKIKKIKVLYPHDKEKMIKKVGGVNMPFAVGIGVIHQLTGVIMVLLTLGIF